MKKKSIFVIIILFIILGITIYSIITHKISSNNSNELSEFTPEEEITDEQLRETMVTLYFLDKNTQSYFSCT